MMLNASRRRHLLCPACRFDLSGTLDADLRRCPECGTTFALDELLREALAEDWTPWAGLRHAVVFLAWRGLAALAAWMVVLGVAELVHRLPGPAQLLVLLVGLLGGYGVATLVVRGFYEAAGCVSRLFAVLPVLTISLVILGGFVVFDLLRPGALSGLFGFFVFLSGTAAAAATAISRLVHDA